MNKKQLYENIMYNVSQEVKKVLNETKDINEESLINEAFDFKRFKNNDTVNKIGMFIKTYINLASNKIYNTKGKEIANDFIDDIKNIYQKDQTTEEWFLSSKPSVDFRNAPNRPWSLYKPSSPWRDICIIVAMALGSYTADLLYNQTCDVLEYDSEKIEQVLPKDFNEVENEIVED